MIRKIVMGTLATGLVAGMIFGRDAASYVRTACSNVRDAVRSEITPEFELSRIRSEFEQVLPDIRKHKREVAELTVSVRDMERDIERKQSAVKSQKASILALRADLKSNNDTYRTASHSRATAEARLARKFSAFVAVEDSLQRDRQLLETQQQTLLASQQKLETALAKKEDLGLVISQLEARLKTIQASEAINSIEVDDTRLTQVEDMIDNLNHELDVRESLLEMEGYSTEFDEVEIDESIELEDIASEIDNHFGLKTSDSDQLLSDAT